MYRNEKRRSSKCWSLHCEKKLTKKMDVCLKVGDKAVEFCFEIWKFRQIISIKMSLYRINIIIEMQNYSRKHCLDAKF